MNDQQHAMNDELHNEDSRTEGAHCWETHYQNHERVRRNMRSRE
jgi:hypothetical protein